MFGSTSPKLILPPEDIPRRKSGTFHETPLLDIPQPHTSSSAPVLEPERFGKILPPSSLKTSSYGDFLTVPRSSSDGTIIDPPKVRFSQTALYNDFSPTGESRNSDGSGSGNASIRGSISVIGKNFTKRASQIILEVPAAQFRRMNKTEGASSLRRETKHFSDNTTLHGPKRIYYGKRWSMVFWVLMMLLSLVFLVYQVTVLMKMYFSTPTVSQVSFIIDDNGLDFPMVTMCNFNPVKKSYIKVMNKTGDFTDNLLDYLMQTNEDVPVLYGNADRAELHIGDADLKLYKQKHPNFTQEGFFMDAGFDCPEIMKMCSFAGRQFDCCKYMHSVLTNLGKCWTLDILSSSQEWMHRQTSAGVNAGLQLILDTHLEEQFDGTGDDAEPIFSNAFENGYRYYVHARETIPYLASEGISVSPSTRVYSAITTNKYVLLSSDHWGNCSEHWPPGYKTYLPYTSANCGYLCKAAYFNHNCGCSPFQYNIDQAYNVCTPYQTIQCIDQYVRVVVNGTNNFNMPACLECKIECESIVYHAYNSYGHGFSNGALKWLNKKNPNWSIPHVKSNFLTINVFFRDMGHTEYTQIQATSITETLSDIGGNMGMFLGMSLITVLEVSLYLSKISWIAISKKRREYMYDKKKKEEEREKQLEETVSSFKVFRSRKEGNGSFSNTRRKISELRAKMSETVGPMDEGRGSLDSAISIDSREEEMNRHRQQFLTNGRKTSLYIGSQPRQESMIQFKVSIDDLKRNLEGDTRPLHVHEIRRRASTMPAHSDGAFYLGRSSDTYDDSLDD